MLKHLSLAALVAAGVASHSHAADACTLSGYTVMASTYWAGPSDGPDDQRCTQTVVNGQLCRLRGWLIAPPTGTNLPGVIYQHGEDLTPISSTHPTEEHSLDGVCEIVTHLVEDHYAVFVPLRRGVMDSTTAGMLPPVAQASRGFNSSGTTTDAFADAYASSDDSRTLLRQLYLGYQMQDDLEAAINQFAAFTRNGAKIVDKTRIAIMGHSYGGVATQIAADDTYTIQPQAFVSLSGAALSWNSSPRWSQLLDAEADHHKKPLYLQGVDGEETGGQNWDYIDEVFSHADGHGGGAHWVRFGRGDTSADRTPADCVADGHANFSVCIHGDFVKKQPHVDHWYPYVHDFLAAHM